MKKSVILVFMVLMLTNFVLGCQNQTPQAPQTSQTTQTSTAAAQSNADSEETVIKLGFFSPLTGSNANSGAAAKNSLDMYLADLNARGGLLGKQVKAFYYDDVSNPEEAVKVATRLVEIDKVDLCIGSVISSCVLSSGNLFNEAQIPMFGTGISPTWMQQGWEYVFRACLNTQQSIYALPKVMQEEFGFKTIAIFTGQDDYGVAGAASMTGAANISGMTITTAETYVPGDTDFSGQVAKMLDTNPDCVFLAVLSGDCGPVVKQLRQFGFNGIIFYAENMQRAVIDVAGDAANYVAYAYPYILYDDPSEANDSTMREFLEKYLETYGEMPSTDTAYRVHDSMLVLEEAVTKAGSTEGAAVRDAVLSINNLKGLGGTFNFSQTKDGEGLYEFSSFIVVDGKNIPLDVWKASDDYTAWLQTQK